jgi:hypothetical protein
VKKPVKKKRKARTEMCWAVWEKATSKFIALLDDEDEADDFCDRVDYWPVKVKVTEVLK